MSRVDVVPRKDEWTKDSADNDRTGTAIAPSRETAARQQEHE